MAIPSGSGSEVLERSKANSTSGSDLIIHSGTANHIYSFLSIIVMNTVTAAATFGMHIQYGGSSSSGDLFYILGGAAANMTLVGQKTFIFNDRLVLVGADDLVFNGSSSCNIDIWNSYIHQDWS